VRATRATVCWVVSVGIVLAGCAEPKQDARGSQTPTTSTDTADSSKSIPQASATHRDPDAYKSYDGLMRIWDVSRSCASPGRLFVHFKAGELANRTRARMVATGPEGRLFRSAPQTIPVSDPGNGGPDHDSYVSMRGVRTIWRLDQVAGPRLQRDESSTWTVTIKSINSGRVLVHPDPVTVPSCSTGTWTAPPITLTFSEVRRDCGDKEVGGDFFARVQLAGLVYGMKYVLYGTAQGGNVNMLFPYGTTYDGVQQFSPLRDLRPGASELPKPFPRKPFVAKVRAQFESPDSFYQDETSEYVSVHVPACSS
jgi:hypothetical protein